MSCSLASMDKHERRSAQIRRMAIVKSSYQGSRTGLGCFAAIDAQNPSMEFGFNVGARSRTPKKLHARQISYELLKRCALGNNGPGKRYPEGYRYPGSNK